MPVKSQLNTCATPEDVQCDMAQLNVPSPGQFYYFLGHFSPLILSTLYKRKQYFEYQRKYLANCKFCTSFPINSYKMLTGENSARIFQVH